MASSFDNLSHERENSMPAIAASIEVLTSVLLAIRICSRFATNSHLGFDDILIVAAWIIGIGLTISVLIGTEVFALDRHIWDVPPKYYARGGLIGFVTELLFFCSTCLTKVSVLMFYRRLVEGTVSRRFKIALWTAIAFVVAYTIVFFILIIVACNPVKAIWLQYDPTWPVTHQFKCAPRARQIAIAKMIGALSVVTDFYSVMLPTALLAQITIQRSQRIGLFFIFGIGLLVCGAGIARTYYLGRVFTEVIDKSWWTWKSFLASIIECNVAIVCACAPSAKALFRRQMREKSSRYGTKSGSSSYWQSSNGDSIVEPELNSGQRRSYAPVVLTSASNRTLSGTRIVKGGTLGLNSGGKRRYNEEEGLRGDEIELANVITTAKIPLVTPGTPFTPSSTQKQARIASQDLGSSLPGRKKSAQYRSDDDISLINQHVMHDEVVSQDASRRSEENLAPIPVPKRPDANSPSIKTSRIPAPLFSGAQAKGRRDVSQEKLKSARFHAI